MIISSVQLLRCVRLFATPWTAACQASLSITNSRSPPKPMSIVSAMPSNHLMPCCPLLLLPSIFPSIRVFSNESALRIRWPKYWSFSFNISPSNEHPGLISFRMDWLDLLAVQGTFKSLFQHHSSKASILWCSAFFIVQLSHPYMTTGKTIALIRWIFVGKVMSLLFNMLSRLVITLYIGLHAYFFTCDMGLPRWLSGKQSVCKYRRRKRREFDSWVGKMLWRRKWQPTPVFLHGEFPQAEEPRGLFHEVTKSWDTT